ncbi:MAG: YihY/virulence factor BrkB family protein [Chthoniobacterales bacterium]
MAGSQREEQELGESLGAWRSVLGELFRSILRALDPRPRLKRSLRNQVSVWISLAAILGWVLSRIPAKRDKVYVLPSNEDQKDRGRKTSLSVQKGQRKGRLTILSMGLELLVAVGLKILKRYGKSWSSKLFSNRKDSPEKAAVSRRGFDKTAPAVLGYLHEAVRESVPHESHPSKSYQKSIFGLFRNTATEWIEDKCPQLGAALAYFTVFSLAPLILVLLAVFGLFFGSSEHARDKITEQLQYFIDPSGIKVIKDIAASAAKPTSSVLATSLGIIVALFGASGVFGQLQDALNTIWGVKPKPGAGLWGFLRARFLSFAMVAGVCFLLLVSLTVETVLRGLSGYLKSMLPGGGTFVLVIFFLFDLVVIILLFAMIFRYLPDAKIAWHDVWVGATLTAVLFVIGKFLLGLYLGSGAAGSAYGAASSLISLLLWIYYATQIVLFGAEFTQVYTNTYGSHIEPEEHAVRVERTEVEVPNVRQ